MNTIIADREALQALTPFEVTTYLHGRGWRQVAAFRDTATIWQAEDPAQKLLVPRNRGLDDYARSIGVLLDVLQDIEGRSQTLIWQDIAVAAADVLRLRLTGGLVEEGSLPLDNSVTLIQRARDLMLAAASAAVTPRAAFPTRKPDRAVDYLKTVRAGQTEHGSYVLTLISPVEPELGGRQDARVASAPLPDVQPFERQVMRTLLNGLSAARRAAERATASRSQAPFENAVEEGVSANLCEAIADLVEAGGGGMELACAWSHARPAPAGVPRQVFISQDFVPIFRAAARAFRDQSLREEDAEVRGFVVHASKRTTAATGTVIVQGTVNGQPKRVRITLTGEDYKAAVRAHEAEVPVVCYGRFSRSGNHYVLKSPHDFQPE